MDASAGFAAPRLLPEGSDSAHDVRAPCADPGAIFQQEGARLLKRSQYRLADSSPSARTIEAPKRAPMAHGRGSGRLDGAATRLRKYTGAA
ncbi:MAG TPA: hypothetical protein VFX38_02915, partial [Gammaproteobacteria bacterium]|nr:hypothetical protein [Gammaproteobacteria bacterium]